MDHPFYSNDDMDADLPPPLMRLFINSVDTLRHRQINQKMPSTWNDKPPLFLVIPPRRPFWSRATGAGPAAAAAAAAANSTATSTPAASAGSSTATATATATNNSQNPSEEEDPALLKGMIRKGIPAPLRCAVWLSNILQASYPHQPLKRAHAYRTLAKVQVLDHAYLGLWDDNGGTLLKKQDVRPFSFGHDTIWEITKEYPGKKSLENVLFALHHVLGIMDYAPMIPTLCAFFLGFMSESYVFCAIREMAHHSTWYWPGSKSESIGYQRAFWDVLQKLHPHSAQTLQDQDMVETYTKAIFQNLFSTIFIREENYVLRILDIYTLEGMKVLFRLGVALVVLYQKSWKDRYIYASTEPNKWFLGLQDFCATQLNFGVLLKKAYGVHGKGVRQRFRFPRRPILQRLVQLEEERYYQEKKQAREDGYAIGGGTDGGDDDDDDDFLQVQPLGLVPAKQPDDPDIEPVVPRLAESTVVRAKLAEWLPLSLRFTKLDLIYSTNNHGRTLESLYRHVSKTRQTILLLEPYPTTNNVIVGMYASQTWHPSTKVYGDGACFLFRILVDEPDKSACWKWHPKDLSLLEEVSNDRNASALLEQFQVGTREYISMGGNPDGSSGLRLNEDLTKAESSPASGFDNLPLMARDEGDGPSSKSKNSLFEVGLVEVYQMVRQMDGMAVH